MKTYLFQHMSTVEMSLGQFLRIVQSVVIRPVTEESLANLAILPKQQNNHLVQWLNVCIIILWKSNVMKYKYEFISYINVSCS